MRLLQAAVCGRKRSVTVQFTAIMPACPPCRYCTFPFNCFLSAATQPQTGPAKTKSHLQGLSHKQCIMAGAGSVLPVYCLCRARPTLPPLVHKAEKQHPWPTASDAVPSARATVTTYVLHGCPPAHLTMLHCRARQACTHPVPVCIDHHRTTLTQTSLAGAATCDCLNSSCYVPGHDSRRAAAAALP